MIANTYACDVCSKQKGEVNHWWLAADDEEQFLLLPWKDDEAHLYSHLCGHECAGKFLSQWMELRHETHTPKA